MFRVRLINYLILPKSMGFDCFGSHANKNSILRLDGNCSDSLVNNQILSEIIEQNRDASFTDSQI